MAPEIIQMYLLLLRLSLMNIVLGGESFVQQIFSRCTKERRLPAPCQTRAELRPLLSIIIRQKRTIPNAILFFFF